MEFEYNFFFSCLEIFWLVKKKKREKKEEEDKDMSNKNTDMMTLDFDFSLECRFQLMSALICEMWNLKGSFS